MKNKRLPFTLVSLNIGVYDSSSPFTSNYPGESLFDDRSDFIIDFDITAVAVLMNFCNDRTLTDYSAPGIRRSVAVALVDATDGFIISNKSIRVNMSRGEESIICRVDLPLAYDNINFDHTYKICVRDENSGLMLDQRFFHVFPENFDGKHVSDWFTPIQGGLTRLYYYAEYRSLAAECPGYYGVRFRLNVSVDPAPWIMPEMEIRIHFPDGSIVSRFCKIECQDFDLGDYQVETTFFMRPGRLGIGYAELICMDYAIAGFVFCTDGDEDSRAWAGEELMCLDEYTLESATERYKMLTESQPAADGEDAEADGETDDEFEKLLQDFIESQIEEEVKEEPDEEEPSPCPDETGEGETDTEEEDASPEGDLDINTALNQLTGLKMVKEKLSVYETMVKFNKLRRDNSLPVEALPLHAMFLGSPGTGKTTVAKMMGSMMRSAGVLSRGHVVVKERATLLGPYYSNEETNTLKAVKEAQGGILFIDEAYQLYQPNDPRDPGKFVIEALMTALADESNRDWMLILAGYPDEMKRMFEMNPGLRSRIPESNIYTFEDFTVGELMEIAESYLNRNDFVLAAEAREELYRRLAADYATRDKGFGNARHVINLIQTEILPAMASRVLACHDISAEQLSTIQPSDIPERIITAQARNSRIGYRA